MHACKMLLLRACVHACMQIARVPSRHDNQRASPPRTHLRPLRAHSIHRGDHPHRAPYLHPRHHPHQSHHRPPHRHKAPPPPPPRQQRPPPPLLQPAPLSRRRLLCGLRHRYPAPPPPPLPPPRHRPPPGAPASRTYCSASQTASAFYTGRRESHPPQSGIRRPGHAQCRRASMPCRSARTWRYKP